MRQFIRDVSTAGLRYLPTILKLAVFAMLDYTGNQEITGNYGLFFATISVGSFFLGCDITSILHRKFLSDNLSCNGLLTFQVYSVLIVPGTVLIMLFVFGIMSFLLALSIFTEMVAQELYRSSMLFTSLKKYTLFYVLKNSLPILFLYISRSVGFSIIFANIITIFFGFYLLRRLIFVFKMESISTSAIKSIIRDSIFNLPNSLFLRSLELGLRHFMGNSTTVQSLLNYLVLVCNGIYSIYDVFVVNVHYKKWMEGNYRLEMPKSLQYILIGLLVLLSYFRLDYIIIGIVYIFVMIVGHSVMMNNLGKSRTSLILLLSLVICYSLTAINLYLVSLMPVVLIVYNFTNCSEYEISHKNNLYLKV